MVLKMIRKSRPQLWFSTYSTSYLIHSWKSAPRMRVRFTCHSPVMPGRTESRASRHPGQNWFSRRGLGRGPTMDICPANTLKNWGISSMLVLRMKRPDAREPRVVFNIELRPVRLIVRRQRPFNSLGVLAHRAEFEAGKFAAAQGLAPVRKEKWKSIFQKNCQHHKGVYRQRQQNGNQRKENVKKPFEDTTDRGSAGDLDRSRISLCRLQIAPLDRLDEGPMFRVIPQHGRSHDQVPRADLSSRADPDSPDKPGGRGYLRLGIGPHVWRIARVRV